MTSYELIDAGDGRRLERFGAHLVDRPQPTADGRRQAVERWDAADLRFDHDDGWRGTGLTEAKRGWSVDLATGTFELRPTESGQVGVFPEHATLVPWLVERVAERGERPAVLNLFASTGLVTLALARAGAAVAHIDAAKSAVGWARRNAALSGLEDRPVRWLVDDVRAFVAREVRRGRRYDGVVLDPPTYGHGTSGKAWRLEHDLPALLDDVDRLLVRDGFLLLTAHTGSLDPYALGAFIGRGVEVGELAIDATSGVTLRLGAYARISSAS